jgi:hypothetical protein
VKGCQIPLFSWVCWSSPPPPPPLFFFFCFLSFAFARVCLIRHRSSTLGAMIVDTGWRIDQECTFVYIVYVSISLNHVSFVDWIISIVVACFFSLVSMQPPPLLTFCSLLFLTNVLYFTQTTKRIITMITKRKITITTLVCYCIICLSFSPFKYLSVCYIASLID